jgi:hypothetical protein
MKAIPLLLGLALALTVVSLAPTGAAWCTASTPNPVVQVAACSSGWCHYSVLQGTVNGDCPPLP